MSGIAEVLLNLGYEISGSDLQENDATRRLRSLGAEVRIGHDAANLADALSVVVISTAVKFSNPEVMAAKERKIPVIPRAEMLAELMRMKYGIAVAGSHGKTTTTSMIGHVLTAARMDPTLVIGGRVRSLAGNAQMGRGDILVAEADESDGTFLLLSPAVAVVTNIDREHIEYYGTTEGLADAFLEFINKVPFYGVAVLCLDHPTVRGLIPRVKKRVMESTFTVLHQRRLLGPVTLPMPGRHSVANALAAIAVAAELGIDFTAAAAALGAFAGIHRRSEIKGEVAGVLVMDDYGHHPTEIETTLQAIAEGWGRPLTVVFQPHRYSRTKDLFEDFVSAFDRVHRLILTDVYGAGEDPIPGTSGEELCRAIRRRGHMDVEFVAAKEDVAGGLLPRLSDGDMVLTLGAGDIYKVGEALLESLREQRQ
ncbi:UDP-N-acetylmuramate--L-alanine ligase [Geodia barretti]|uniref:UDP-N-acetylmuramate--L-alanine ligase n=1 Tax=Geodia barretti TaxID=519541 RepID=A0AA35QR97_GEOBA|nr:UDP-N-acetylmuramate--L-alanine ligase [Geodia barretti]